MSHQPEDREYPGVVLIANQKHPRGPTRCGADEGEHFLQGAGRDPHRLADVGRMHGDVVFSRSAIAKVLE